jgi:hypothetical protein
MKLLVLLPISFVVGTVENDGCMTPISRASISSVSGSTGFDITCPSQPTAASLHHKGESHVHRSRRLASFLQVDDPNEVKVCMQGPGSPSDLSQAAFADLALDDTYVIRRADFTQSTFTSFYSPTSFSLNARALPSSQSGWYTSLTDADSGTPWTKLVDSSGAFDSDVAGKYVRVFPSVVTQTANGNAFGVVLYGCPISGTVLISFTFKSSKTAIISRFGKLSAFVNQLTNHVCLITKFTNIPAPCPRILFATMTEGSQPNPAATEGAIEPTTLPSLEVFFRILPPDTKTCADCRSASAVHTGLLDDINTDGSKAKAILQAIDLWIEDPDPYSCYATVCPAGTLCVNNRCVTPTEIVAQGQAETILNQAFESSGSIDSILKFPPLQVIEGVDRTKGGLIFSNSAVTPGAVLAVSSSGTKISQASETTPVTTSSDESFLDRFLIPIIVGSVLGAIIVGLVGYKVYKRTYLTEEAKRSTA